MPFVLLYGLVRAVEASKLVELASERANLGFFATPAGDYLLEGVQAGLAVLILVLIRVARIDAIGSWATVR